MTLATKHGPPDLGLERDLIVSATVITNDLETLRSLIALARFFGAALCTTLGRHHIALVKDFLFLFREQKNFFALHARGFYVRHMGFLLFSQYERAMGNSSTSLRLRRNHESVASWRT